MFRARINRPLSRFCPLVYHTPTIVYLVCGAAFVRAPARRWNFSLAVLGGYFRHKPEILGYAGYPINPKIDVACVATLIAVGTI